MSKDPFAILGVPYDASRKDIATAYRRLAFTHHPDVSKSQGSIALMQEINWAYEVLSHPEKRRRYYEKQQSNGKNGSRKNGSQPKSNGRPRAEERMSTEGSSFNSPAMEILGGTADRAIIGAGLGLTILGASLLFGTNFASAGALVALVLGVWIGSGPNTRMSSQNGVGIGGVIGLFYGAIIGISIFGSLERSNLATGLLVCAPSMILLGASLGATLGGLAAGLRKLQAQLNIS